MSFTTRRISSAPKDTFWKNLTRNFAVAICLILFATFSLRAHGEAPPQQLHFSIPTISLPKSWFTKSYTWKDAPPYKNERLAYYQKALRARGITKNSDVKVLVAQLIQEAGSLSEATIGDHGCSFGIIQYNACAHEHISAQRFLEKHPEWKSWTFQLDTMADMVVSRFKLYPDDVRRVVIHHNSPAAARRGVDTKAGYYSAVASRLSLLIP